MWNRKYLHALDTAEYRPTDHDKFMFTTVYSKVLGLYNDGLSSTKFNRYQDDWDEFLINNETGERKGGVRIWLLR